MADAMLDRCELTREIMWTLSARTVASLAGRSLEARARISEAASALIEAWRSMTASARLEVAIGEAHDGIAEGLFDASAEDAQTLDERTSARMTCQRCVARQRFAQIADALGLVDDRHEFETQHQLALGVDGQVFEEHAPDAFFKRVDFVVQSRQVEVEDLVVEQRPCRGAEHLLPDHQHPLHVAQRAADQRGLCVAEEIEESHRRGRAKERR